MHVSEGYCMVKATGSTLRAWLHVLEQVKLMRGRSCGCLGNGTTMSGWDQVNIERLPVVGE